MSLVSLSTLISTCYLLAAVSFIVGLKRMSSPVTAQSGITFAGLGMLVAILITFIHPDIAGGWPRLLLIAGALAVGSALAWWTAQRVEMTDMPQMIALYNGLGGGAAAAIAAIELLAPSHSGLPGTLFLAMLGALIGATAFSGSLVAYAKLQGIMRRTWRYPAQNLINGLLLAAASVLGLALINGLVPAVWLSLAIALFFAAALVFGVLLTVPIGGADMPVVISLYNALTGLAVGFEGYALDIPAMMIAGIVVGSAGTLLTQLMAKAMNRSLGNVLFAHFGSSTEDATVEGGGAQKPIEAHDVAAMLAFSSKVIVVPGYGMAVAQAQHKIWELAALLRERGVEVRFAIHPVAGRMPGHMNVLLAEAGVPYELIFDLEEINAEFAATDTVLVIGANDVVNPAAREDRGSPIYGMPILDADRASNVVVIKRGQGAGFSGISNRLFTLDNCRMLFSDGAAAARDLVAAVKTF